MLRERITSQRIHDDFALLQRDTHHEMIGEGHPTNLEADLLTQFHHQDG